MKDDSNSLDPMELSLQELESARQAGLFDQTRIDTRDVLQTAGHAAPLWRRLPVGLLISAAASLILAVGIGSYLFYSEIESIRYQRTTAGPALSVDSSPIDCDGDFFSCVTGPSQIVMGGCHRFDYDLDGDVDLTDFRSYQLSCNGITR